MAAHYRWSGDELILQLRLSPRSSRDQIGEVMGDRLKVSITAPPVDGKANAHLTKFLAKEFGVSRSQVVIVSGVTHRDKNVSINCPQKFPDNAQVVRP
ncbi:MAG: DUF167 family protein [Fuerstiella sp.]